MLRRLLARMLGFRDAEWADRFAAEMLATPEGKALAELVEAADEWQRGMTTSDTSADWDASWNLAEKRRLRLTSAVDALRALGGGS